MWNKCCWRCGRETVSRAWSKPREAGGISGLSVRKTQCSFIYLKDWSCGLIEEQSCELRNGKQSINKLDFKAKYEVEQVWNQSICLLCKKTLFLYFQKESKRKAKKIRPNWSFSLRLKPKFPWFVCKIKDLLAKVTRDRSLDLSQCTKSWQHKKHQAESLVVLLNVLLKFLYILLNVLINCLNLKIYLLLSVLLKCSA